MARQLSGSRVGLAIALTPLVAAVVGVVLFPVLAFIGGGAGTKHGSSLAALLLSIAGGAVIVAVPVTVLGVAPGVFWANPRGRLTHRATLIGGAVLGNSPVLVLSAMHLLLSLEGYPGHSLGQFWPGVGPAARILLVCAGVGVACAEVFWRIASHEPAPKRIERETTSS